jgi:hypothetical protein
MQCRSPPEVAAAGVDQVEVRVEQPDQLGGAAFLRGFVDGFDRLFQRGGTVAALLEIAGKELDRLIAAGLADLVDGAAVIVGQARIESAIEGAAYGLDIAGAGRCEHALAGDFIDTGFERPPAWKAVVARNSALRFGELGARLLRPQCFEALLSFVLQMLEVRLRGKRLGGTRRRRVLCVHE